VPNTWISARALQEALAGVAGGPGARFVLARVGNRRLGGSYQVLLSRRAGRDYLLLRGATKAAAAGLPRTPDAAAIAAAAARPPDSSSSDDDSGEDEAPTPHADAEPTTSDLPPEISAALAALPPPGPGDASVDQWRTLLATSLPFAALPAPAQLPAASVDSWGRPPTPAEREALCATLRLLRVRRSFHRFFAPPPAPLPAARCRSRPLMQLSAPPLVFRRCCTCLPHHYFPRCDHPQAVPCIWVAKSALLEALGAGAAGYFALARIGDRRLGSYEVLIDRQDGREHLLLRPAPAAAPSAAPSAAAAAAPAAAAAAPAAAPAAALTTPAVAGRPKKPAATPLCDEDDGGAPLAASRAHKKRRTPPPPARSQPAPAVAPALPQLVAPTASAPTASMQDLPTEVAAALAALPPPGPDDATRKERRALLATAMPEGALPLPAQLPSTSAWVLSGSKTRAAEIKGTRRAVTLLRVRARHCAVRGMPPGTPPSTHPPPARPPPDRCTR